MASSRTTIPTTRSEFADAVTVILLAAAALIVTGIATTLRVASTFREEGIAWSIPIDEQPISATTDSGAVSVEGIAQEALVVAPGVDAGSTAAIVGAIALWTLATVVVIAAVVVIAWNCGRGRFFARSNARALDIVGWTLALAPVLIVILETWGRNGVTAALGISEGEPTHPIEFWSIAPIFATGVTVGLISTSLRRALRLQQQKEALQKDTEGLV